MRSDPLASALWAATMVSLPLVGVGLIHWLGGRDLGAGLIPAYVFMAAAWIWQVTALGSPEGRRGFVQAILAPARRPVWWALLAIAAAVTISGLGLRFVPAPVVGHEAGPRFMRQVVQLVIMLAFTTYAVLWVDDRRRWRATLRWLGIGLLTQLVYGPLQGLHTAGLADWAAPIDRALTSNPALLSGSQWLYLGHFTAIPRLRGSMCEPLYLGSFLLAVVPLMIADRRRWLAVGGVVLLVATWSRGAWLAAIAAVLVWLALVRRTGLPGPSRRFWLVTVTMAAAVIVAVVLVAGPGALTLPARRLMQVFDGGDWSNLTRLYGAQVAWRAFLASPVVGVGWGQFAYHFYDLVDLSGLHSQFTWPVASSLPLLLMAETGLIGLSAVVVGLVMAARATWLQLVVADPDRAWPLIATTTAAAAMAVQLLIFSQYNLPHLWIGLGLWLARLVMPEDRA